MARGPVARLVAEGARNSHAWTPAKESLLKHFDDSGVTGACLDPEHGGLVEGPKNLALALVAFELAWVDAGAATGSLAGSLALAPIHERGTPEQRDTYMRLCAPAQPGEDRRPWRGSFVEMPLNRAAAAALSCGSKRFRTLTPIMSSTLS